MTIRHLVVDARCVHRRPTGIGRYVASLLEGLDVLEKSPVRVTALVMPAEREAAALTKLRRVQLHPVAADFRAHPAGEWFLHVRLPRLMRELGADSLVSPYFIAPTGRHPFRRAVGVLDSLVWDAPEGYPPRYRAYQKLAVRAGLWGSDAAFALSTDALGRLAVHLGGSLTPAQGVVPASVDRDVFKPNADSSERERLRRALKIPDGQFLIVTVGSGEPRKNLPLLLRAMRPFTGRVVVALVGDLDRAARRGARFAAGDVPLRFVRHASDRQVAALLRGADLVLQPSRAEGFGLPLLEAMACGANVVASAIPSHRDIAAGTVPLISAAREGDWTAVVAEALASNGAFRNAEAPRRAGEFTAERSARALLRLFED